MNTETSIVEIILASRAATAAQAEEIFLNEHLAEVLALVASPISEQEFRDHALIRLLFAHGSRAREDSLA